MTTTIKTASKFFFQLEFDFAQAVEQAEEIAQDSTPFHITVKISKPSKKHLLSDNQNQAP